jgi:hypothetical protein
MAGAPAQLDDVFRAVRGSPNLYAENQSCIRRLIVSRTSSAAPQPSGSAGRSAVTAPMTTTGSLRLTYDLRRIGGRFIDAKVDCNYQPLQASDHATSWFRPMRVVLTIGGNDLGSPMS